VPTALKVFEDMDYYKHIAPLALKSMISDDFKPRSGDMFVAIVRSFISEPRSGGMIVKMTLYNIDILSITISMIMPNKLDQREYNT
jgi:hypothetical protein